MPKLSKVTCLMLLTTEYSRIWKVDDKWKLRRRRKTVLSEKWKRRRKKENIFIGLTWTNPSVVGWCLILVSPRKLQFYKLFMTVCLFCSAVQWGLYMCQSWEQSKHLKMVIQCLLCDTILALTRDFVVFVVSRHLLNPLIRKVSRNNKRGKIPSIRLLYV